MTDLSRWAAAFGSPFYLYELSRVDQACADLLADLPPGIVLYFSLKANPHPQIAARLRRAGCRAEVSSAGELATARQAGFGGTEILFTGPGKTPADLSAAIAAGARRFSVESPADYDRLARAAERAQTAIECLLRVNTGRASGASGLRMTGSASAFGIDIDQLLQSPERFVSPSAPVVGAHFFPLCNARDEQSLLAELAGSAEAAAALRDKAGLPMRVVDLGGGFAAPYAQHADRPRYPLLAAKLSVTLDQFLPGWRDGGVEVCFESGRYLCGDSGELVCTVLDVKHSAGQVFLVLDAGINHLGGMAGLGRMLPASELAGLDGKPPVGARGTVVGPLCTPADVLSRQSDIGGLAPGDLVRIPNTGAYGLTASLIAFLSRTTPAEVVADAGELVDVSRLDLVRTPIGGIPQ
ncbi:alanine racemase [Nonomuraea sp. NPDC050556]|uniref:alanine racemase n=1 Tax=Nonomuraea sp. NPDC050556 TaxID=3364369 RepID=UPI00378E5712